MIWTVCFQEDTVVSGTSFDCTNTKGSHDTWIKFWDIRSSKSTVFCECISLITYQHNLRVHPSAVRYLTMKDYTLLSASNDGQVVATDTRKLGGTGEEVGFCLLNELIRLLILPLFLNLLWKNVDIRF